MGNKTSFMFELKITKDKTQQTIKMVNSWEEVTIGQFIEIQQILFANISDTYKSVNLISVLTGISVDELESYNLNIYSRLNNQLNFLHNPIPKINHKDVYEINGTKYILKGDISAISTSQYIDYQEYLKEGDPIKLTSVWLIPEGHAYNDGYDIHNVWKDISQMKFVDVQAIGFFFKKQLAAYILIMKDSSVKRMKKQKKSKAEIRKMETLYNNMASFHLL